MTKTHPVPVVKWALMPEANVLLVELVHHSTLSFSPGQHSLLGCLETEQQSLFGQVLRRLDEQVLMLTEARTLLHENNEEVSQFFVVDRPRGCREPACARGLPLHRGHPREILEADAGSVETAATIRCSGNW